MGVIRKFSKYIWKSKPSIFLRKITKKIWSFLTNTAVPVWFIILSAGITFYTTYQIAPKLNKKFENNKVQSQLTLSRIENLNTSTRELLEAISLLAETAEATGKIDKERKIELLSKFSALQWRAIEIKSISGSADIDPVLLKYQQSLNNLKSEIANANEAKDIRGALAMVGNFARESANLNNAIYRKAFKAD